MDIWISVRITYDFKFPCSPGYNWQVLLILQALSLRTYYSSYITYCIGVWCNFWKHWRNFSLIILKCSILPTRKEQKDIHSREQMTSNIIANASRKKREKYFKALAITPLIDTNHRSFRSSRSHTISLKETFCKLVTISDIHSIHPLKGTFPFLGMCYI